MIRIRPFQGWRYDSRRAGSLASLITPPYDVIDAAGRQRLAAGSPHSFVNLILPQGDDPHAAAARTLDGWCKEGILRQDAAPTLTLHRQSYVMDDGRRASRLGVLALLDLSQSAAAVRPHETTLAGPRQDRTRLMLEVRAHLSQIFMVVPDPAGDFEGALAEEAERSWDESFDDPEGVHHDLRVVADAGWAERLGSLVSERSPIIADGHHRFESALLCLKELQQRNDPDAAEAALVLVELVSLASPGLVVLPTHRIASGLDPFDGAAVLAALQRRFRVEHVPRVSEPEEASRDDFIRLVEAAGKGTFGMVLSGVQGYHLVHAAAAEGADPISRMDVGMLHQVVLQDELGLTPQRITTGTHLRFTRKAHEVIDAVRRGPGQAGFVLNAPSLEELERVTSAGQRMPQKSTYFHPKVPSGLVLHSFASRG